MTDSVLNKINKPALRILGIAPYDGLRSAMLKAAKDREDIELEVFVGDLEDGLIEAEREYNDDFDVIVSRGGTAELLREHFSIPVIDIPISVYDILRALKLAEAYEREYAFVGFPGLTKNAALLCSMLQYDIDIVTIHSQSEAESTLNDLKSRGYKMVLCDMITSTTAKHIGLNAILITSGLESIEDAFTHAEQLTKSCKRLEHENQMLKRLLSGGTEQLVVFNTEKEVVLHSIPQTLLPTLKSELAAELPVVFEKGSGKFFKNLSGTLYSFVSQRITINEDTYAAFYFFASSVPFVKSKYGIEYSSFKEIEDSGFNSLYNYTNNCSDLHTITETLAESNTPVMLTGEEGCGKAQAAGSIYSQGHMTSNPLVTINCSFLTTKSWEFLINHYNSPFNDNNNTIFIRNLCALTPEQSQQLLSLIRDTNLARRNRLIFSCTTNADYKLPEIAEKFVNNLNCAKVCIPPLRQYAAEIPTLTSLYLNTLNVRTANQIIGVDREAVRMLKAYPWPGNFTQFKRVLNQLALITTTPYISADNVRTQLKHEDASISKPEAKTGGDQAAEKGFDLSGTLVDINRRIVDIVLNDCSGNHTLAAKKLGISRSTLWRYLK